MQRTVQKSVYLRPSKFFRIRLLTLTNDQIVSMLEEYDKEVKRLKKFIASLCWYMRGMSYAELMSMSTSDISNFNSVLDDNVELSKKTKQLII